MMTTTTTATTSSLLEDLPSALLAAIVQYIDDPRSICALEQTSKTLRSIIVVGVESPGSGSGCWKRLYDQRWTTTTTAGTTGTLHGSMSLSSAAAADVVVQDEVGVQRSRQTTIVSEFAKQAVASSPAPPAPSTPAVPTPEPSPETIFYKTKYKHRHLVDVMTQHCIDRLMDERTDREDVVRAVAAAMSFGRDCLDLCWKNWKKLHDDKNDDDDDDDNANNENETVVAAMTPDSPAVHNNNINSDDRKLIIASCLLRSVHCSVVFQDIRELCCKNYNNNRQNYNHPIHVLAGTNNNIKEDNDDNEEEEVEDPSGVELEEYVIASSRMFFDLSQGPSDTKSTWIRNQLDQIATIVQERFMTATTTTKTTGGPPHHNKNNNSNQHNNVSSLSLLEQKLHTLNSVFFDEFNFTGNRDHYYDFDNSLLHKALERRTGIPMTLAILYKCIARRVGLKVDIIGLPGHIVIGVPSLRRYVDVFRKRQHLLTVTDCERIVNSYGYAMVPEYIQPLSPAHVFRRVLNNCGNSLAQSFPPNASKRMTIEAMRAVLINPTNDQVEDCRRWFSQILWGSHSTAILREMSQW